MHIRKSVLLFAALLPLLAIHAHCASAAALGAIEATYNFHANYLTADPDRSFMYATTSTSLEIINSQSLAVVKSIPLASGGRGMGLSPDGSRLYVAGGASNSVYVFDANSQTLLNTLSVGDNVAAVAAGLDNRLFVQTASSTWYNSRISQIDASTGASRGVSILGGGNVYSGDMQISPDRMTLYYGNFGLSPGSLYKIDVSTTTPQQLWKNAHGALGSNGQQVVLSHDGSMISYVLGGSNGYAISNLSTANMSLKSSFDTDAYPNAMAYSADDRWAFALRTPYPTTIEVYDTTTSALVGQFAALDRGSKMLVDRTGAHLFVSYNGSYNDKTNLVAYSTGIFVPEPSTWALASIAALALPLIYRRRARK